MNIFQLLIVQPIFNILFVLYNFIGDFGIAVIILTILVRFALWPLVKKQLRQTKLMRSIQPELKKIKKKSKGNKQMESMLMMELYREKGIKPFSSILVLIIQLPIFIAIFQVVRLFSEHTDKIEQYTYSFLHGLDRIATVIADPGAFNPNLLGFVDLTKHAIGQGAIYWPVFVLAILAAVFQFVQSRQTMPNAGEKKKLREIFKAAADGKEVDQSEMSGAMMKNMTFIFPLMTFFIAIYLPGALVLYYAVTSAIAVAQQKYILGKDIEDMEKLADKPDKKRSKRLAAAREAEIVSKPQGKSQSAKKSGSGTVVRRISASGKKGGK